MMQKKLFLAICAFASLGAFADEAYRDQHVRFTIIDEGTIRLEYAPDGRFVDNKSFVAVCREYADVPYTKKETAKQVTITTSKFRLVYKKDNGPLSAQNLSITSAKSLGMPFTWKPGTQQKDNLKGTYRTLDGYNGENSMYEHRPMPIEDGLLATDGWSLIDDSKGLLFDGSEDWDWVTERTSDDGAQDWYFMAYGHNYKQALQSFTKFAGRVPMPPRYVFGYWWSRYWSYSDQDFRDLITNFEENDIPLDVLVIDMDWHPISEQAGGGWTGWDWNERLFPDYKQFLQYLDAHQVKTTMNLHPADGVRPFEKKYQEFRQKIGMKDGETREWLGSDKQYVQALFDTYLHPYIKEGVDFWWIDWQQWLNDKKISQLSNTWWCNYIFFSDMERHGVKRPLLYHRWGGLGNHRYQIGFSGDSFITWESLNFLPYFNSTASNVLYGYWSHDIGGHQNAAGNFGVSAELYTRAMQMGAYLPIIRTHSTKDATLNKEPWAFDQVTQGRLKKVIRDRYALVPYIYTMARTTYETGLSLCRPMYYDYPEAKEAYEFRNQYMFGDQMMIAPVTEAVSKTDGFARLKVWLPEGQWMEYATGTMLQGGQVVERAFNMDEYPVYVKAGSILPYYGKVKNLTGTDQPYIVRVFPGADQGEFTVYEDQGEDCNYATEYATTHLSYERKGHTLTVNVAPRKGAYKDMPARRQYHFNLPCQKAPSRVTIDGQEVPVTYDGYQLEAIVSTEVDCNAGTQVVFELTDGNDLVGGLKAKLERIHQAVADFKQADCGMVYTENFGYLEATPLRLAYHPEMQDETLAHFRTLYDNLPLVLMEQMSNPEHSERFLRTLDEKPHMQIVDLPASFFRTADGREGFDVTFFNNERLEGEAVTTAHWAQLNLNTRDIPAEGVKVEAFSLRALSTIEVTEPQDVFLVLEGDDGYRMFVDDRQVMADWRDHTATTSNCLLHLEPGHKYQVRVEFYDHVNDAVLKIQARMVKKQL